jgi:hypothetical protein
LPPDEAFLPLLITYLEALVQFFLQQIDSFQLSREKKITLLLDQARQVLRLHRYSINTERSYVDWIVRFVQQGGHGVPSPLDDIGV